MRGHDLASRCSSGERPERAFRDRMTQKHHADKRSRTRRRIQSMTRQRCQDEIHSSVNLWARDRLSHLPYDVWLSFPQFCCDALTVKAPQSILEKEGATRTHEEYR